MVLNKFLKNERYQIFLTRDGIQVVVTNYGSKIYSVKKLKRMIQELVNLLT